LALCTQALSSLGPSPAEHQSSALCGHSGPESVRPFSLGQSDIGQCLFHDGFPIEFIEAVFLIINTPACQGYSLDFPSLVQGIPPQPDSFYCISNLKIIPTAMV